MNEKFLNDLLASAIKRGDIDVEMNDKVVDGILSQDRPEASDDSKMRMMAKIKSRIEDAAISQSKDAVQWQGTPLGRYLEAVREKAGLTRVAIANRLNKDENYLLRLERGDMSPVSLPVNEFARVIELFNVRLGAVSEMVMATVRGGEQKQSFRAAARSHGGIRHDGRSHDVEKALDAFAKKLRDKSAQSSSETPAEIKTCMSRLEAELKKRGRTDLLT